MMSHNWVNWLCHETGLNNHVTEDGEIMMGQKRIKMLVSHLLASRQRTKRLQ